MPCVMRCLQITILLHALAVVAEADGLAPSAKATSDGETPSTVIDATSGHAEQAKQTAGTEQAAPSSVEPSAETIVERSTADRGAEDSLSQVEKQATASEGNPSESSHPTQMQICSTAADGDSSKCQMGNPSVDTFGGRQTDMQNVRPAPKSLNGKSLDPDNEEGKWWLGDMEAMISRTVVAMDTSAVVLCYSRLDRGGCRFAKMDAKEQKLASGLLPQVGWGEEQLFHTAKVGQVEARRLDATHLALCFESIEDSSIGCLIATVNSTASPELSLGEALVVKPAAHLLSLVVTTTTRFSMCHRLADRAPDGGDCYSHIGTGAPCTTAHCYLGEVDGSTLRWAHAPPHVTKI